MRLPTWTTVPFAAVAGVIAAWLTASALAGHGVDPGTIALATGVEGFLGGALAAGLVWRLRGGS